MEAGLSYPDITMIHSLAKELHLSVTELMNTQKEEEVPEQESASSFLKKTEHTISNVLELAQKSVEMRVMDRKGVFRLTALLLTAASVVAVLVCCIVNLALEDSLTWALYPIAGCALGLLTFLPLLLLPAHRVVVSILCAGVGTIPFLFLMEYLLPGQSSWALPFGLPAVVVGTVWLLLLAYLAIYRGVRLWYFLTIMLLSACVITVFYNWLVSICFHVPFDKLDTLINTSAYLLLGVVCFFLGLKSNRRK